MIKIKCETKDVLDFSAITDFQGNLKARDDADFEKIERLFNKIRFLGLKDFDILSIGMSGDWPIAVRHSATIVRIGTDIFGPREY